MSKTKILFRIMSLILFIGFFFSCEDNELVGSSTNEVLPKTTDLTTVKVVYPNPITSILNRVTGEYHAEPGSVISLRYSANPGAPCYETEELKMRVIGANPSFARIEHKFNGPRASSISGSKTFTMPASGIVRITAEIRGGNGCSRANITFNDTNKIELGTGGYGKRKFP